MGTPQIAQPVLGLAGIRRPDLGPCLSSDPHRNEADESSRFDNLPRLSKKGVRTTMMSHKNWSRSLLLITFALLSCFVITRAQDLQTPDTAPKLTVKDKLDSAVESVRRAT